MAEILREHRACFDHPPEAVAIIGIGCMFPGAASLGEYWSNLRAGVDAISEVPSSHWAAEDYFDPDPSAPDRTYGRRGGFLAPTPFDTLWYGISPKNLAATDTTQLFGLLAARAALEDAKLKLDERDVEPARRSFARERTCVVLGVTGALELVVPLGARLGHPIWRRALEEAGVPAGQAEDVVRRIGQGYVEWQESSFPGLLGNVTAGRIANRFDLGGTNCVVDAACASSLGAVHLAMLELATGRADVALTGGVDTFSDAFMYTCFSKTPALSASGHARPFHREGDGTTLGEGVGVLVLKRFGDALRDGDRIRAVIRGLGSSSDGRGNAIYAPSADGQQRALRAAYQVAGIRPSSIELFEAHGTGTRIGDATEVDAITAVLRSDGSRGAWCALGSVKSMIGHTKAAAGIAGLIKAALALEHKVLPPTAKVDVPLESLRDGAAPVYLNTHARPWVRRDDHPRRAGLSAFGFGGSNFHCVLQEHHHEKAAPDYSGTVALWPFTAGSQEALGAALEEERRALARGDVPSWPAIRRRAAQARAAFAPEQPWRSVLVVERPGPGSNSGPMSEGLRAHLSGLLQAAAEQVELLDEGPQANPLGAYSGAGGPAGRLAVVFPGQGAQRPDMLRELACIFPEFLDALALGDQVFAPASPGERLSDLIYPHPAFDPATRAAQRERLRDTRAAQPALGALSFACWRVLERFGVAADAFAGHSFGELVALAAAGRLSPRDLLELAAVRGQLMGGDGEGRGTMLAVSGAAQTLRPLLATLAPPGETLTIANLNGPRQTVLSGSRRAVAAARRALEERQVKAVPLPVSGAFHSPLMEDAQAPFLAALTARGNSAGPCPATYSNVTAAPYRADPGAVPDTLARQLTAPVRFAEMIERMHADGVRLFVEAGPGRTLTGLIQSILEPRCQQATSLALDASDSEPGGEPGLARLLAQLASLGHPVDLAHWDPEGLAAAGEAVEPASSAATVMITGANQRPPAAAAGAAPSRSPAPPAAAAPIEPAGAAPAPPPAPASAAGAEPEPGLAAEAIRTLGEIHARTAEAHQAYLRSVSQTQASIAGLLGTPAQPAPGEPDRGEPGAFGTGLESTPAAAALAPAAVPRGEADVADVAAQTVRAVIAVVAEKTGYPEDALSAQMRLDADLGIDSIKRVEILSALGERFPALAEPDPDQLGALHTLADLADLAAGGPPPAASASNFDSDSDPERTGHRAVSEALGLVVAVVAEKTGYPAEMLAPGMGLDADLGIDSIKRVEILSALEEQLPGAAAVEPERLAALATLGEVAQALAAGAAPVSADQARPASRRPPASPREPVEAALLAVVADKTGYPPEALGLDMHLDADLGIDSIKRVEILSALEEQLPGAAAVEPERLAALATLGEVAQALAAGAAPVSADQARPASRRPPASPREPVEAALLAVVADKTGYPPEALGLGMHLDADLGIDSIKRVEILAGLEERLNTALAPEPEVLGRLGTLADLLVLLERALGWAGSSGRPDPPPEPGADPADPVPAYTAGTAPAAEEPALELEVAAPAPGPIGPGRRSLHLASDPVWIVRDSGGLAEPIARLLTRRGLAARVVEMETWLTARRRGEAELPSRLGGLVLLAPHEASAVADLSRSFELLQCLGPRLRHPESGADAILAAVTRLDGAFGLGDGQQAPADPLSAGLTGIVKSAAQEWPEVRCKALDVAPELDAPELAAVQIVEELLLDGPLEVGLGAERRVGVELRALAPGWRGGPEDAPLAPGEVVVFTGGGRGITACAARALHQAWGVVPVLLGRTSIQEPPPEWMHGVTDEREARRLAREHLGLERPADLAAAARSLVARAQVQATLSDLLTAGAIPRYYTADVRDPKALTDVLDRVEAEVGAVAGVVHGAGVLADRLIEDKSLAEFSRVVETKLAPLQTICERFGPAKLRLLCLFSSVSARLGRRGQTDYAGANEVLNKLARREQTLRPDCRVASINWGPWAGGMVGDGLARRFAEEGIGLIPLADGARVLPQLLAGPGPVELVVTAPPSARGRPVARPAAPRRLIRAFCEPVSLARFPVLGAHVLDGRAVWPVALSMEWLAQAALHLNPGLFLHGLEDLQVLRALPVAQGEEVRVELDAESAATGADRIRAAAQLATPSGLHVSATVLLGAQPAGPPPTAAAGTPAAGPGQSPHPALYGPGGLFHGPALQGIRQVDHLDPAGIRARVGAGPAPREWMEQPRRAAWLTDPLAIDCAFQLMVVWCQAQHGMVCLPTEIVRYQQFRPCFPSEGTVVIGRVSGRRGPRVEADLELRDGYGEMVARLQGYRCIMDPGLRAAFDRNTLAEPAVSPALEPAQAGTRSASRAGIRAVP